MTINDIATQLIEGCKTGKARENLGLLYSPDAVSVEALDHGNGRETNGVEGIRGKHDWWDGAFEVTRQAIEGPFIHGDDRFAVIFDIEAVEKATGQAMPMREVAIYHVADGKIVREEFFGV